MKFMLKRKVRGSISIFLTIILLPMICMSGLIVDGSRMQLAKGLIASSGDLTMNAALANYDTVLKDVYGLFAMSQTEEDLQTNLYDYFADTLMASNIIEDESDIATNPLLKDVASAFSGQTTDLLSMEVEKDSFKAEGVKSSSLGDPKILKNQIIEYEKYRAPVNAALSILDGIACLKKIFKQGSVTKAKVKTDEAAGDLNDASDKLYKKLVLYNTAKMDPGTNKDYDMSKINSIQHGSTITYKKGYEEHIMEAVIKSLAEDMTFDIIFEEKAEADSGYIFSSTGKEINNIIGKGNVVWTSYALSLATEQTLKDEIDYACTKIEEFSKEFSVAGMIVGKIQNLTLSEKKLYATDSVNYLQLIYNLYSFNDKYLKYLKANDRDKTTDPFLIGKKTDTDTDTRADVIENNFDVGAEISTMLQAYKVIFDSENAAADLIAGKINSKIKADIVWVTEAEKQLSEAIEKIKKVTDAAATFDEKNEKLNEEIQTYSADGETDAFSDQMQADHDENKDNISPEQIEELRVRLVELQAYFAEVKTYLESITFAGMKITEYGTVATIAKEIKANKNKEGITYGTYIKNNSDSTVDALVTYFKTQYIDKDCPTTLTDISIKKYKYWVYMEKAFSVKATEADKEEKTGKEELEKDAETAQEGKDELADTFNKESITDTELPSDTTALAPKAVPYDKKFSNMFDSISSALGDLIAAIAQVPEAGRDNLYVTTYAFDMFSFYTMSNEYKVNNEVKKGDMSKGFEELGLSGLTTESGIAIDATNNYLYGSEIEYLLYGNADPTSNVKSAKMTIFAIRFLANSGFALTNSQIKATTLPPAMAVQAATAGIVPYKLTQVVLQLALALAESAVDMSKLEAGLKVPLVKTYDTWTLSVKGGLDAAKVLIKDEAGQLIEAGKDKVLNVWGDLVDSGTEKIELTISEYEQDMRVLISDQINQAVGEMFNLLSGEICDKLDEALADGKDSIKGTVTAEAQKITEAATSKIQAYINTQDASVRTIMQSYYDENIGTMIGGINTEIESALAVIDTIDAGEAVLKVQKSIADQVETKVAKVLGDLKNKIDGMVSELSSKVFTAGEEKITVAADWVVNATNEYIDKAFAGISKKMPAVSGNLGKASSVAAVISFAYSDYLKVFLFLNLCVNDTTPMQRIANLMQVNVNNGFKSSNYTHPVLSQGGKFYMNKAYTYIEIDATVKLKTMFMSLPMVTRYSDKSLSHFELPYKSAMGY